jgi:hypothetical protein
LTALKDVPSVKFKSSQILKEWCAPNVVVDSFKKMEAAEKHVVPSSIMIRKPKIAFLAPLHAPLVKAMMFAASVEEAFNLLLYEISALINVTLQREESNGMRRASVVRCSDS